MTALAYRAGKTMSIWGCRLSAQPAVAESLSQLAIRDCSRQRSIAIARRAHSNQIDLATYGCALPFSDVGRRSRDQVLAATSGCIRTVPVEDQRSPQGLANRRDRRVRFRYAQSAVSVQYSRPAFSPAPFVRAARQELMSSSGVEFGAFPRRVAKWTSAACFGLGATLLLARAVR